MKKGSEWLKENVLYIAWMQAIVAMAGSLFYSEILKFAPCVLCWYQRICIYPLVVIIPVGIVTKDKNITKYVFPLSLIGLVISTYQNLLYYNFIPETLAPCVQGVSCTIKYVQYLGFISIPLLALVALLVINGCMLYYSIAHKKPTYEKRN